MEPIAKVLLSDKLYLKGVFVSWIFLKLFILVFYIKGIISEMYSKKDLETAPNDLNPSLSLKEMNRQHTEFNGITLKTAENGKMSIVSLQCEKWPKHKGDFYSHKVFIFANFYYLPDGELMLFGKSRGLLFQNHFSMGESR